MPVHDWTRVDAGMFHAFHTAWVTHLSETLNGGLLPSGYYALPEQHAGRHIADVLTLHAPGRDNPPAAPAEGGVAVADAPPRVRRKLSPAPAARTESRGAYPSPVRSQSAALSRAPTRLVLRPCDVQLHQDQACFR